MFKPCLSTNCREFLHLISEKINLTQDKEKVASYLEVNINIINIIDFIKIVYCIENENAEDHPPFCV